MFSDGKNATFNESKPGPKMTKKYKHKLPQIDGQYIVLPEEKFNEALDLMWHNWIEPEDVDFYVVGNWN